MLIDWFTVGAQVVNFLILVWLLKRYLYRPILAAIDARERGIAAKLEAARKGQEQVEQEKKVLADARADLDHKRLAVIDAAEQEAKAGRARILAAAEKESQELRATRLRELGQEKAAYQADLIRLVRNEIVACVRKIVGDLASSSLEQTAVDAFLKRLEAAPSPAAHTGQNSARLRCAFPLPAQQQQQIDEELRKKFAISGPLVVEVDPNLGLGFDLIIGQERMQWTLDSYLTSFEKSLATANGAPTQAGPA
jgi:F-type H+-transporting ATPase subunit b